MRKEITISGMHCAHCSARVEKALNAIEGVKATVNLEKGTATVISDREIDSNVLKETVERLGFDFVG